MSRSDPDGPLDLRRLGRRGVRPHRRASPRWSCWSAIGELSVTPLRSTWFHVIGAELDWAGVARLLDGGGGDWDGALFAPRTDRARRAARRRGRAARSSGTSASRSSADRTVLNAEHFFDRPGPPDEGRGGAGPVTAALRLLDTGLAGARWNVAVTAALARAARRRAASRDTLRLHRYRALGARSARSQPSTTRSTRRLRRRGAEIARRVTGGGAVAMTPGVLAWDLVVARRAGRRSRRRRRSAGRSPRRSARFGVAARVPAARRRRRRRAARSPAPPAPSRADAPAPGQPARRLPIPAEMAGRFCRPALPVATLAELAEPAPRDARGRRGGRRRLRRRARPAAPAGGARPPRAASAPRTTSSTRGRPA